MEHRQEKIVNFADLMGKIGRLYAARALEAQKNFLSHMKKVALDEKQRFAADSAANRWQAWASCATDFAQRSVLFWDILRERGNNLFPDLRLDDCPGGAPRPKSLPCWNLCASFVPFPSC